MSIAGLIPGKRLVLLSDMKKLFCSAILLLLVAAAGCAGGAAEPTNEADAGVVVTPELVAEGRTAYRAYCTQCHGYNGKGDGISAANLDPPPRDHTNAELMDPISDAVIAETIRAGGQGRGFPNMPAFPQVTDEELLALVAYVRSLSRPGVERIDVGETASR